MITEKERLQLAMETLIAEFPGKGFLYDISINIARDNLAKLDEFRSMQIIAKIRKILN